MFGLLRIFLSIRFIMTIIAYGYIQSNHPNILGMPFQYILGTVDRKEIVQKMSASEASGGWGVSAEMAEYLYLGIPFVALWIVIYIFTKFLGFK